MDGGFNPDDKEDGWKVEDGDWTPLWYALRPSGLYLYATEQERGAVASSWSPPALTVAMSSVASAAAASGADFFKAIFVLQRTNGRSLQLRAHSRPELQAPRDRDLHRTT
jgi:hypothetical protein